MSQPRQAPRSSRFVVVGAGAIGMLYAARLAAAGLETELWARSRAQAAQLDARGIELIDREGSREIAIPARAATDAPGAPADVVLLTVKQPDIDDALISTVMRAGRPGALLLCLQNGIGHMPGLRAAMPGWRAAAVVTTDGALRLGGRAVRHTGTGRLWIEDTDGLECPIRIREGDMTQKMLVRQLKNAGIDAVLSKKMKDRIYQKLLLNAVINPLTALYGVKNGRLPDDPARALLMRRLHEEAFLVLHTDGMSGGEEAWARLHEVCRATADNESSMLQDIRRGRRTEVDWINGGIVALARQYGLAAPLHEAMVTLVRTLEGAADGPST
ncbi:2-dehydropantoate 2-reductase [Paenibacillus sp. IB182496]|uniref:2-dehydropantoate 2-reductase n=1 Tax=Paenibacillus sabuli TaxID=2772509 RepID=A0A927GR50_9BACL|nr:2-dehydropantoate 2-reductase [Paenibacillus sabuli]MBD2844412.1 2-dehydropantoate 2-reductase [Paenibacillus sabuli]